MAKKKTKKSGTGTNNLQKSQIQNQLPQVASKGKPRSEGTHKAHNKNGKRTAKRRANLKSSTMAPGNSSTPQTMAISQYDLALSEARLKKHGFHPEVTKLPLEYIRLRWAKTMLKTNDVHRPSRDEFFSGKHGYNQGNYTYSKFLVEAIYATTTVPSEESGTFNGYLEMFLTDVPFTVQTATILAFDGFKTLENLAIANRMSWSILTDEMAIFDCVTGLFHGTPRGRVFLAITPEYSIDEFLLATHSTPESEPGETEFWAHAQFRNELEVLEQIQDLHRQCGQAPPFWGNQDQVVTQGSLFASIFYNDEVIRNIRSIPDIDRVAHLLQYDTMPGCMPYHMSQQKAMSQMCNLLNSIYERRGNLEVLHFQKVSMLDRRLVAVILRGCLRVRMVGIYDCPLIHFGDIVCLLDLINEVNETRRTAGLPQIEAFDFSPNFNYGMPYEHDHAATYGLTWGPHTLEVVQRGFFKILLEAYLKSSAMDLQHLFDDNKAFRVYLNRVPALPFAVTSFLDGLYRYIDLVKSKKVDKNLEKQALYDMLKPVRMELEPMGKDWPAYYREQMGATLYFCSSCGYKVLKEFITTESLNAPPHERICAGCILKKRLDEEEDHGKMIKKQALDKLFPKWNGFEFNDDAPLNVHGRGLMNLFTKTSIRPDPPMPVMGADGVIRQPRFEHPFVRDQKIHHDSLQNLPSLEDIRGARQYTGPWVLGSFSSRVDDVLRMTQISLKHMYPDEAGGVPAFSSTRSDGRVNDHVDEVQPKRRQARLGAFGFDAGSALLVYKRAYVDHPGPRPAAQPTPRPTQDDPGFW